MKYSHIAQRALNNPLMITPSYARHALAFIGKRIGAEMLTDADGMSYGNLEKLAASYGAQSARKSYGITAGGIAVIPVSGSLVHKSGNIDPVSGTTGYDGIAAKIAQCEADPDVLGVMLDIDSPGGEVAGCFALCDVIASAKKPIWGHANEHACSAAYALLSQCSAAYASQTAQVGSIGVVIAHTDMSAAAQAAGIVITLIHAGAKKVDGNPYESLPESVRAEMQESCESTRSLFAGYVAKGRKLDVSGVLATEAAIFTGEAAFSAGLIDGVASFDSALQSFTQALGKPKMDEQLLATARAESATAERARISAILNHPEAKGREAAALAMATEMDIAPEAAAKILAASAKAAAPAKAAAMHLVATLPDDGGDETKTTTLAQRVAAIKGI